MRKAAIVIVIVVGWGMGTRASAQTTEPSDAIDMTRAQRVTVHLKSAMPDAAADAIAAQAGVPTKLKVWTPKGRNFAPIKYEAHDFDVDNKPFVLAVMQLCTVYGLKEPGSFQDDGGQLMKRGFFEVNAKPPRPIDPAWSDSPACTSGPFAVLAKEVDRSRVIDPVSPVADESDGQAQLFITVLAEPRITVLQRPFYPVVDSLVDDQGKSLWGAATPEGVEPRIRAPQNAPWTLLMPLTTANPKATRIAEFSGYVRLQVVRRAKEFSWSDLDDGQPRKETMDGIRVEIAAFQNKRGMGPQTTIAVFRDNIDPAVWATRASVIRDGSRIRLFDDSDVLLSQTTRWSQVEADKDKLTLQLSLRSEMGDAEVQSPSRMTWDFPLEAGETRVPFSFSNLPLPPN